METIGIVVLAVVMSGLAIWAGIQPRGMMEALRSLWGDGDGGRIAWVVGIRSALGVYLLWVAPATAAPRVVTGLGLLFLAAALVVLMMGSERIERWVAWWVDRSASVIRGLALAWVAFAGLLFWLGLSPA